MNKKREMSSITLDEAKELLKYLYKISDDDIIDFNFKTNTSGVEVESVIKTGMYVNVYVSLSNEYICTYIQNEMGDKDPVIIPFKLFKYIEDHFIINY